MEDRPRRFKLMRFEDESGVSGEGVVAYGVQFHDGTVAYHWTTTPTTTQIADDVDVVRQIHGHSGSTHIQWIDPKRRG